MKNSILARAFVDVLCIIGLVFVLLFERAMGLFTPFESRLRPDGLTPMNPAGGSPIDSATQHGLRHEAGVSRRSAARGI